MVDELLPLIVSMHSLRCLWDSSSYFTFCVTQMSIITDCRPKYFYKGILRIKKPLTPSPPKKKIKKNRWDSVTDKKYFLAREGALLLATSFWEQEISKSPRLNAIITVCSSIWNRSFVFILLTAFVTWMPFTIDVSLDIWRWSGGGRWWSVWEGWGGRARARSHRHNTEKVRTCWHRFNLPKKLIS